MAKPGGFDPRWAPLAVPGRERFEHSVHGLSKASRRCGVAFDAPRSWALPRWQAGLGSGPPGRVGERPRLRTRLCDWRRGRYCALVGGTLPPVARQCASPLSAPAWPLSAASRVVETGSPGTGTCRSERLGDTFDAAMSCRGFCAWSPPANDWGPAGGPGARYILNVPRQARASLVRRACRAPRPIPGFRGRR